MLPSMLYAASQKRECKGNPNDRCHYCAAPCDRSHIHEDYQPPFQKVAIRAVPNSPWECEGCWLFHRTRVMATSVSWKKGEDRHFYHLVKQNWWITEEAKIIVLDDPRDRAAMRDLLMKPPKLFMMMLLREKTECELHLGIVNHHQEVQLDTKLGFTLDGVPHYYTVYELESAVRNGSEGTKGGTRLLAEMFAPWSLPPLVEVDEPPKRGRPPTKPDGRSVTQAVAK